MHLRHRWSATALAVCLLATTAACSDESAPESPGARPASSEGTAATGPREAPASPAPEGGVDGTSSPGPDAEPPSAGPSGSTLPGLEDVGKPLAAPPWPAQAAAAGRLVEGFPEPLRPVRDSQVVSSSVTPSEERLQVALEARTSRRPDAVLRGYRVRMARHGIKEKKVRALGGSRAAGFRSGRTSITVTATRTGSRTTYTVFGVVDDAGE